MSTSRNFGVNPSEYAFYSTIACIDMLRGIMVKDDFETILSKSQVIRDYLERASNVSALLHRKSKDELYKFYELNRFSDKEECQQLIRNLIDDFSAGRECRETTYIQRDFARLIGFFAEKYGCKDVYEPFAGRATFAEFLPQEVVYLGQEINPQLCMLANLRLESQYRQNSSVEHVDSFNSFHRSDMIISEMPWGVRLPNHQSYESYFLEEASYHARKVSVGIYPYSILIKSGQELDLRKRLIESDLIDCVIKLPARLYAPYSGVQTCIIITNRYKRNEGYVRFIDASSFVIPKKAYTRLDVERLIQVIQNPELESREAIWVRQDAILAKDANLAVERYQPLDLPETPEGYSLVPLYKLLERISTRKPTEETMVPLVRVSDLAVNPTDHFLASFKVEKRPYRRECMFVDRPAIFISRIGSLKPTGYVEEGRESGRGVYLSPDVYAFCTIGEVSTPYLLNELTKDYVQKQLIYAGSYIQTLTEQDFLNVQILLPSLEEQNLSVMQGIKEKGELTIADAKTSFDAEWRDRQHTLGHVAAEITLIAHALDKLMQEQHGVLRYEDIADVVKEESVQEYFEKLIFGVDRASFLIKHLADEETIGEKTSISLKEFFSLYKRQHVLPNFNLDISKIDAKIKIEFAEENWMSVVENIFSNIKKYAFPKEYNGRDNKVIILTQPEKLHDAPAVSILIMNNGAPLDEDITPEMVFRWGKTSSKDLTGQGLGGNHIKKLVEHFGGEVSFLTEQDPKAGYTTAYKIVLPLING